LKLRFLQVLQNLSFCIIVEEIHTEGPESKAKAGKNLVERRILIAKEPFEELCESSPVEEEEVQHVKRVKRY
jgi:hypothetical protein